MSNVTRDPGKLFFTASHPNLGDLSDNGNLVNIISEVITDTYEISEPGHGGDRVETIKKDKSRKITVECQTGTPIDTYLRRCMRYGNTKFSCSWSDERVADDVQGGQGRECRVNPNTANDRGAETMSYEINSFNYSGD